MFDEIFASPKLRISKTLQLKSCRNLDLAPSFFRLEPKVEEIVLMPMSAWPGRGYGRARRRRQFLVVAGDLPTALPRAPLLPHHPLDPPEASPASSPSPVHRRPLADAPLAQDPPRDPPLTSDQQAAVPIRCRGFLVDSKASLLHRRRRSRRPVAAAQDTSPPPHCALHGDRPLEPL